MQNISNPIKFDQILFNDNRNNKRTNESKNPKKKHKHNFNLQYKSQNPIYISPAITSTTYLDCSIQVHTQWLCVVDTVSFPYGIQYQSSTLPQQQQRQEGESQFL
ncbi:hypothetical protein DERF_005289 [Dermatophagoides farinae]|uniref:Uncharacterized protein n=1 Tax=Dermatophagoides farinae TaxID=6954 RepID=A0A922I5K3_DERFA|nr:hypothetical protein DERF_005289 [Dermatophagoides farinae]